MDRKTLLLDDPFGAEFERHARSAEMRHYLRRMPIYAVEAELPDRMVQLLKQIEEASDRAALRDTSAS
jgi:hypothetical protein